MQNRFGLKDFVLLIIVALVGLSVWLAMVQEDRRFKMIRTLSASSISHEQALARIQRAVEQGARTAPADSAALERIAQLADEQRRTNELLTRLLDAVSNAPRDALPDAAGALKLPDRPSGDGSTAAPGLAAAWARPGDAPITRHEPWGFATDGRDNPDHLVGGEFVEVFEAKPAKITPVLGEDTYSRRIQDLVLDRLAEYDPITLKLRGVLAEAWQYDPDGYWLRVKLRENAVFSDGHPVTADDVVYSFHGYVNNPELETESLRSIMTQVESYTKVSDYVVDIKFKEPNAYNLDAALVFYVLPSHFYSKLTPKQINQGTGLLMGSGPFKLLDLDIENQWAPPQPIVLVRNEQYWAEKPSLARLRWMFIEDERARLTTYTNSEADMILPSSPQFVELTSDPQWHEKHHSLNWVCMRSPWSFIAWQCGPRNGKLTPFHDKRVRQAMTLALDRERMIRDIWAGVGTVATGAYNAPSPACNPDITPWPYDPERAKALLAEAGWIDRDGDGTLENERGDQFTFEFTRTASGTISERIGKYIEDQCAKIGIRCNQRVVDWANYDQILKTRDFDSLIMSWSASSPESDPSQIWHSRSIENQGHNFVQWRHPDQDPIIEKIRTSLDFNERMKAFHQFHALLHEEQPYTFVRVTPWLRFVSKRFNNVRPYPKGIEQREFYISETYDRGL